MTADSSHDGLGWLYPDWDVPNNVVAMSTVRFPGSSEGSYNGCNLATHVGDNLDHVSKNRKALANSLPDGVEFKWLNQVHGTNLVEVNKLDPLVIADASFTQAVGVACCILTADCLPILLTTRMGNIVAAVHAGWRSLAGGVLEKTVSRLATSSSDVMAWLGPAIGPCHFEVGKEVRELFLKSAHEETKNQLAECFQPSKHQNKFMADLYQIARVKLSTLGVNAVFGGGLCTYCQEDDFYSFRRENPTGRMATLIYLKP
jgi:YfiH family protein